MNCRHCATAIDPVGDLFVDLGTAPPSNALLPATARTAAEAYLPLRVVTCRACRLVQVDTVERPEVLFADDYAYHSSWSTTWLAHARRYVDDAAERLALGPGSFVVELASNDGYLLQYVAARGIRCLGIEPTAGTARVARERGIETVERFFGDATARAIRDAHGAADLIVANNVLAHVPDINDFVAGVRTLLAPTGTATFEFPHLLRLVQDAQFDTIYHEHYSYLSLGTVSRILARAGLRVVDVEELPTHGGSLRVWAMHDHDGATVGHRVTALRATERTAGMEGDAFYRGLQARAERVKDDLLLFLIEARRRGERVVGYGAAAKGNTLLNFAGIRSDLLPAVADVSPYKQGRLLPGSRIPVVAPEALAAMRPDHVLILPWNLRDEIVAQLAPLRDAGTRFVTAIPHLEVV
jgi:SAM-dependent methyltransferase